MQLNDSVQYLKGVGEKRAKLYEKLGIHTVGDLIEFFPELIWIIPIPVRFGIALWEKSAASERRSIKSRESSGFERAFYF